MLSQIFYKRKIDLVIASLGEGDLLAAVKLHRGFRHLDNKVKPYDKGTVGAHEAVAKMLRKFGNCHSQAMLPFRCMKQNVMPVRFTEAYGIGAKPQ